VSYSWEAVTALLPTFLSSKKHKRENKKLNIQKEAIKGLKKGDSIKNTKLTEKDAISSSCCRNFIPIEKALHFETLLTLGHINNEQNL
jgi:hypothetical protein